MRVTVLALVSLLSFPVSGAAQPAASTGQAAAPPTQQASPVAPGAVNRAAAMDLSYRGRHGEALPMLEALTKDLPNDVLVWERYAVALYSMSATLTDMTAAQQMRLQAKAAFNRSRQLGNNSALAALADAIPADGSEPPLSSNQQAQAAMAAGEASFGRGDFTEAIAHYQKALSIEPTNYNATLFVGDSYYRLTNLEAAGDWFARAIALNPNAETAYRYWGDALMRAGRGEEARSKFIDAFIAEPYSQSARTGLAQFAKMSGARIGRPAITPFSGLPRTADGGVTIDLKAPQQDPMAAAWVAYATAKAQWSKEEFLKRFPSETVYRHSLAEEIEAFGRLLSFADDQEAKGQPITDPQVATIRGLRDRGLLEAYVLLHAPTAGVSRDYAAYRAQHRNRLQAYMDAMVAMPPR
jgi:tetratricopeptide (TPR) repeat protein